MSSRQSMRPVTIRRVVEICRLVRDGCVSIGNIMETLKVNKKRAKEVVFELQVMKLINLEGEDCSPNSNTQLFLENFENEKWKAVHAYFFSNYSFYRDFVNAVSGFADSDSGLSFDSIFEEAERQKLKLNRTSIEVLADWCDRLGIVQRHLYTGHVYFIKPNEIGWINFTDKLVECFAILNNHKRPREVFIEIPRLREDVCERCKIPRATFDLLLKQIYLKNIGRLELCSAPITTMAKKSPLKQKEIRPYSKEDVLAPGFLLRKERDGLVVGSKSYYYITINSPLSH